MPLTRTEELRHPDGAVIVTIVIDGHITGPVRKRENIYTFDRETYRRWYLFYGNDVSNSVTACDRIERGVLPAAAGDQKGHRLCHY